MLPHAELMSSAFRLRGAQDRQLRRVLGRSWRTAL